MKKLKIISLFVLIFMYSSNAFAQLKIDNVGRTKIGSNFLSTFDDDNQVTMALFGNQSNGSGAKLSFGNFRNAANNGMNLFIGEYNNGGNWDSDILQIHGKNAIYFTGNGSATSFITKFHTAATHSYYSLETGAIVAYDIYVWSDNRLKKNMKTLVNSLEYIRKLRGVSYDMITTNEENELTELNKLVAKDAKEAEDLDKRKKSLLYKINIKSKNNVGFSAQEIEAILPQAVEKDNNGFLAVNYIKVIPFLVEAMKEQQTIIDAQKTEIENLKKDIIAIKKKVGMD